MPFLHGEAAWPPIMQHTAYGDPVAGIYAAVATLIALYGRQKTGGITIDLSQVECLFQLAADGIIAQSTTGSPPPRTGNQRTTSVWRGCLRCRGDDAWIAVDIEDTSGLLDDLLPGGISNLSQDQIGTALAAWAAGQSVGAAVECLQRAKIAAGPVMPAHALLQDPHLIAAGYWRQAERRYVGSHFVPKPPFAIDGRAPPLKSPAPTLGEHNNAVLTRVLGLQPAEIIELERTAIIGSKAS
jgi:crotonobetainyl-CoA:carnitine CoA-transferase CaiB-like acyl-CoA transferase